ncbi:MAG: palmitoyl-CoA hydrolase, partial [Candidatus Dormibacteraeota bacterium]|nr:palmitoyl-CoA hydrolase [Candidatus Dormibacteraeota bacterium]
PTSPEPFALTPGFLRALEDREEVERTFIPVERINGPVLLLSGSDDAMWPSSKMSDMVVSRLREHGHPHPVRHLRADGTGHWIQHPHLPTTVNHSAHPLDGVDYAYGGEPAAQARGQAAAWEGVLQFLAEVFGTQGG